MLSAGMRNRHKSAQLKQLMVWFVSFAIFDTSPNNNVLFAENDVS